jgi:hypothetical protein
LRNTKHNAIHAKQHKFFYSIQNIAKRDANADADADADADSNMALFF